VKIRRLSLEGFRLFPDKLTIDWEDGLFHLLGRNHDEPPMDSNGAGKTSLVSAIPWILYGKIHTGAGKDDVINWDSQMVVGELTFDNGLVVERGKRRGKAEQLRYFWNGQWQQPDIRFAQADLNKILGVTETLFFNSLWISQESSDFLRMRPSDRLKLLEEVLMNDLFTKAQRIARDRRNEAEARYREQERLMRQLAEQETQARLSISSAQLRLQQAAEVASHRQQEQAAERRRLDEAARALRAELEAVTDNAETDALTVRLRATEADLYQTAGDAAVLRRKAEQKIETFCAECMRPWDPEDVAAARARAVEAEKELAPLVARQEILRLEQENLRKALADIQAVSREAHQKRERLKGIERQIKILEMDDSSSMLVALQQAVQEAQERLRGVLATRQANEAEMVAAGADVPLLRFWEKGFSSSGLRNMLLDEIRACLQAYVDAYCKKLAGNAIRIELPPSTDKFEILIHHDKGVTEAGCMSTGTLARGALAFCLALGKTIRFLSTTTMDFLVVDDPIGTLDRTGETAVLEMVSRLQDEFSLILVTLPREVPGIPPETVITIERLDGKASVLVGGN